MKVPRPGFRMEHAPDLIPLPRQGFRRTPWKNGGGVTVDIADAYRPGAEPGGWTGMVWRFGATRIERPAPFSDLSGQDRILVVTGGRGLVLRVDDGQAFDARPLVPVRFPGEWAIRSELGHGPVEVLNLMGDRERVTVELHVLDGPGTVSIPPGDLVLHAPLGPCEIRIDGRPTRIDHGDAVRLSPSVGVAVEARDGVTVAASIRPRSDVGP